MVNLKKEVTRKQSSPNFPKNKHFLPPDINTDLCVSGCKKRSFFRKIWRAFLLPPFWDSPFCLITDKLSYAVRVKQTGLNCLSKCITSISVTRINESSEALPLPLFCFLILKPGLSNNAINQLFWNIVTPSEQKSLKKALVRNSSSLVGSEIEANMIHNLWINELN